MQFLTHNLTHNWRSSESNTNCLLRFVFPLRWRLQESIHSVYYGLMQPPVASLRPLSLLRGGEATIADFDTEAERAMRLSVWLKPGAYLLAAAAVVDSGLAVATTSTAANGSSLVLGMVWAVIAMAILGVGQAAWLHASARDINSADANPDAEWRWAISSLASGELQCWRSVEDELDHQQLRRVSSTVFSRPFGILLLSPSGLRRWFGDRSIYASSRQSYFYDDSEWRLLQRRLVEAPLATNEVGASPAAEASNAKLETIASTDWRTHAKFAEWANYLFMPHDRFRVIVDRAYPDGYMTANVCKPRLALLTAHRLLNQQGPGVTIDIVTAEIRTSIWRYGFVDNTLGNSARHGDLTGKHERKNKPADGWIAVTLRGKYAAINTALENAESELIVDGRLAARD